MRRRLIQLLIATGAVLLICVIGVLGLLWARPFEVSQWYNRSALESAGFDRQLHDHDHGHITFFEAGTGPPLVFVHGLSDQAGSWHEVAAEFDEFKVIVVDLPDHGKSPVHDDAIDAATGLDVVFEFLDGFADDEPLTLVGNSLGGWISMEYALSRPNRVQHLVAIGSAGLHHQVDASLVNPTNRDEARQMVHAIFGDDAPDFPGFILDRLIESGEDDGSADSIWSRRERVDYLDDRIHQLHVPTDLVWGTEDRIMPMELGHRFHDKLPNSTLHSLDGCGHVPQLGCPDELVHKLRQVLTVQPTAPSSDS